MQAMLCSTRWSAQATLTQPQLPCSAKPGMCTVTSEYQSSRRYNQSLHCQWQQQRSALGSQAPWHSMQLRCCALHQQPATEQQCQGLQQLYSLRGSVGLTCASSNRQRRLRTCKAAAEQAQTQESYVTCRRCHTRFLPSQNHKGACSYHPAIYSGGELAKAIGFVRASDAPEHQLKAVMGRQGLLRFWDCCGAEAEDAPGCETSFHVTWDTELNERNGWER